MSNKVNLNLPMDKNNLFIDTDLLESKKEILEKFIEDETNMKNLKFVRNILPTNEVQSNNMIEGYFDDIEKIKFILNEEKKYKKVADASKFEFILGKEKKYKEVSDKDIKRILNLASGYSFILKNKSINENNLKRLYNILSDGLLSEEDLKNMGDFYRNDDVYIFYSNDITKEPDLGVSVDLIQEKMNCLFDFINNYSLGNTLTDEFIKSQIIHFYFVYIHPYFDINGRTARTTGLWHLLNKKAYPFVIFNRGIQMNKNKYYKIIRNVKNYNNVNIFFDYMMDNVLLELKKEHVIQSIKDNSGCKLTATDYQTLHYLLSINSVCTAIDFSNMYNRNNEKKKPLYLHEHMLVPLIDKKIIVPSRNTKRNISSELSNYEISLNSKFIDDGKDLSGIKILKKESFD